MNKVKKFLAIIENLIFMIFCMIVILFLVQLFCFTSFKIPSDSMGPALKDGDSILVIFLNHLKNIHLNIL